MTTACSEVSGGQQVLFSFADDRTKEDWTEDQDVENGFSIPNVMYVGDKAVKALNMNSDATGKLELCAGFADFSSNTCTLSCQPVDKNARFGANKDDMGKWERLVVCTVGGIGKENVDKPDGGGHCSPHLASYMSWMPQFSTYQGNSMTRNKKWYDFYLYHGLYVHSAKKKRTITYADKIGDTAWWTEQGTTMDDTAKIEVSGDQGCSRVFKPSWTSKQMKPFPCVAGQPICRQNRCGINWRGKQVVAKDWNVIQFRWTAR